MSPCGAVELPQQSIDPPDVPVRSDRSRQDHVRSHGIAPPCRHDADRDRGTGARSIRQTMVRSVLDRHGPISSILLHRIRCCDRGYSGAFLPAIADDRSSPPFTEQNPRALALRIIIQLDGNVMYAADRCAVYDADGERSDGGVTMKGVGDASRWKAHQDREDHAHGDREAIPISAHGHLRTVRAADCLDNQKNRII